MIILIDIRYPKVRGSNKFLYLKKSKIQVSPPKYNFGKPRFVIIFYFLIRFNNTFIEKLIKKEKKVKINMKL